LEPVNSLKVGPKPDRPNRTLISARSKVSSISNAVEVAAGGDNILMLWPPDETIVH
jgi:hypothetical protein